MYIIIVGGGQVGYYLAKILLNDGHEVLIIERNPARCQFISDELGSVVMRGDGCEAVVLEDAGTGRADMLIAVTGDDEDNLVACQVAKHKFKVRRTIARVKNPENEGIFNKLGVDVTISSTRLILAHIEQELPAHPLIQLLRLRGGALDIVEVRIPPESPAVGRQLHELRLPPGSLVCLVLNKEAGPQVPSEDTVLRAEDEVIAVARPEAEESLRQALAGKQRSG